MRYMSNFIFFKNVPINDVMNTLHFESNTDRDIYFMNKNHFVTLDFNNVPFNYIKDMSTLTLSANYYDFKGVNYCTFTHELDKIRYYAFVDHVEYVNDDCIRLHLLIDGLMTFTQGDVLTNIGNVEVLRQHLDEATYKEYLPYLQTNNDVLHAQTKQYVHQVYEDFGNDMYVLIQSSIDISPRFGNEQSPRMKASNGVQYDNIISPMALYFMEIETFKNFNNNISRFPWIVQGFKRIILIPKKFIDNNGLEKIDTINGLPAQYEIFTAKDGGQSNHVQFVLNQIMITRNNLLSFSGLTHEDEHLLRSEYVTLECHMWNGQSLNLDIPFLPDGLILHGIACIGHHNEIKIYPANYMSSTENETLNYIPRGTYLQTSMEISNFDEIPVYLDSATLTIANNANQRQYEEDRLIFNQIDNTLDSNTSLQDKFFNVVSMFSNLSPSGILSRVEDQHYFYKRQQAQQADLRLTPPTITNSNNGNALLIASNSYGVSVKISAIGDLEKTKIRTYYKSFGYQTNNNNTLKIDSMSMANFLQFKGNWHIPNIDNNIMSLIRLQLENGVRFWHVRDLDDKYIMDYNLIGNRRRL